MDGWKLWFVLLVLLTFYTDSKASRWQPVKITSKDPDVIKICTNETENPIILTVCKIQTERSRAEECRLLYKHGQDFVHECDSRFTLMKETQTVFLHLTKLTSEDSGNYTCECTTTAGTLVFSYNVTVEDNVTEDEISTKSTEKILLYSIIGLAIFILISGVILGFIYTKKYRGRKQQLPITSQDNAELYTQSGYIEPYSVFMQKENGLYLTTRVIMTTNN